MNIRKLIDYSIMFQSFGEWRVYIYFIQEDTMALINCGNAKLVLHHLVIPP